MRVKPLLRIYDDIGTSNHYLIFFKFFVIIFTEDKKRGKNQMLDDFLTQRQADEFSYHGFYDPYDVDCDDGTMGDVIYIMHKEEPVC